MRWLNGRPRRLRGYTDLGPIRIPPLPPNFVLTDRDDETLWHLSFTVTPPASDGYGYITINDSLPSTPDLYIFGPFDGPVLAGDPRIQLLVRGGYLGFEIDDLPQGITDRDQARIMARVGLQNSGREIIIPVGFVPFDDPTTLTDISELAWEPLEF